MRLVPKYDKTRPIRERLSFSGVDKEVALLLTRFLRGATVEGRALCHAKIVDALVAASAK